MLSKGRGSLVAQLQREVLDSSVPISDILRKAKVLATLLKSEEFKRWVDAELKGYASADDLPDYRKFRPVNLGTFAGFNKVFRNVPVPVALLPDDIREFATRMEIRYGVGEIEASAIQAENDTLRLQWPAEAVMLAREHVPMSDGSVLVEAWQPFSQSEFVGILNQIRNHLLDFLLELQQINPDVLESEDALRAVSGEKVQSVIQTIVYGNENTVATGTEFTQTVTRKVVSGDTQSLIDHLRSVGLDRDSLVELETAIEQDGDRQQKPLGKNVKSWIGKMVVKAMDGTWKVAMATAPDLLKAALSQFYGGIEL